MLNPATIKTVSDLRENPLGILKEAKEHGEPLYILYRSTPQAAILNIEDLNNLLEEIEDLQDALDVLKRQRDPKRKLVSWNKVKKDLNLR